MAKAVRLLDPDVRQKTSTTGQQSAVVDAAAGAAVALTESDLRSNFGHNLFPIFFLFV